MPEETDWARFKRLPPDERDRLGFEKWTQQQPIDTGDIVTHGPTGETWLVARVDGSRLAWSGWPPGWAELSDCTLIEKASPAYRLKTLRELAASGHHCAAWAKARLEKENTNAR